MRDLRTVIVAYEVSTGVTVLRPARELILLFLVLGLAFLPCCAQNQPETRQFNRLSDFGLDSSVPLDLIPPVISDHDELCELPSLKGGGWPNQPVASGASGPFSDSLETVPKFGERLFEPLH